MIYSIIIPAYNESVRIRPTLHELLRYIREQNWDAEILVVNDGSSDDTAQIVREYVAVHPQVLLIENPGNRGKGFSVRNGMLHARGDICLFTDADLSSPITEAPKLFDAIDGGADIAIGSRWLRTELQTGPQPLYRQLFGRIFNLALPGPGPGPLATGGVRSGRPCAGAGRPSAGMRPSASFLCKKLNAGGSIPRFCFSRAARDCGFRKFQCCGRTAKARGCILSATGCACSWKFCGSVGMR